MAQEQQETLDNLYSNKAIAQNSLFIVIAQFLGLGFGLLFDLLTASTFGVGENMDAIFVALTIPQIIYSVFVSTGIRIFSPILSEAHSKGGDALLSLTFSSSTNYMSLLLLALAMIGFTISPLLTSLFGLSDTANLLAIKSIRILCFSLLPLGLIELIKSLLVNQGKFFLSSLSNFIRYGSAVTVLLLFKSSLGVITIPWAYVAGVYGQLVVYLAILVYRLPKIYHFTLGKEIKMLPALIDRLGPPTIGELVGQSNVLIEVYFASFLPSGIISVFGYGRRFLAAANGLISNSVVVAAIPRLSFEVISNNIVSLRKTILFSVQLISLVTGFFMIVFIGSGKIFEILLTMSNRLPDIYSVHIAVMLLMMLGPTLFFMGITQVFIAPFYAYGETKIIMYFRILFLGVNFFVTYAFVFLWKTEGLVIALVISQFIQSGMWLFMTGRRLHGLDKNMVPYLIKYIFLTVTISLGINVFLNHYLAALENIIALIGAFVLLSITTALCIFFFAVKLKVFSLSNFVQQRKSQFR